MDPTTTLITFMLQTSKSTQSVSLVGSWDNFTKHYPMERDARRSRGQWRGCYAFKDIICDGDGSGSPKRSGGLKMGHTYWYYYELDGSTETYDSTLPCTTSCPYLPGQPVNTLWVPVEVSPPRIRSASTSSIRREEVMTMNPADKFLTPRAPPALPRLARLNTSPSLLENKAISREARSASPRPAKNLWSPRSLFGLRTPPQSPASDVNDRGRSVTVGGRSESSLSNSESNRSIPTTRMYGSHTRLNSSREASPQSHRSGNSRNPSPLKYPVPQESVTQTSPPTIAIPDEIAEEEEDDDNFASLSAQTRDAEATASTGLSPPAPRKQTSLVQLHAAAAVAYRKEEKPLPSLPTELGTSNSDHSSNYTTTAAYSPYSPGLRPPPLHISTSSPQLHVPRSHFSIDSLASELLASPTGSSFTLASASSTGSPTFNEYDSASHDDDDDDDDDDDELEYGDVGHHDETREDTFSGAAAIASAMTTTAAGGGFVYNPAISEVSRRGFKGFQRYSLPDGDYGSELTIRKLTATATAAAATAKTAMTPTMTMASSAAAAASAKATRAAEATAVAGGRMTFGGAMTTGQGGLEPSSALDDFLNDLGYLGGVIVGKD